MIIRRRAAVKLNLVSKMSIRVSQKNSTFSDFAVSWPKFAYW